MDRLQGLSLGAVDYITKPFDVQELRIRVRNVLRRSKLDTLLHPITGLPTSVLVEEQMERVAQDSNLALVNVNIKGMPAFNDAYGFVTHDDVLRAVTLILQNTAAEIIHGEPFVGQVDAYHFIIIAPANQKGRTLLKRVTKRLNEAISFFYPHREWESGKHSDGTPIPMIEFQFSLLPSNQIPQQGGLLQLRKTLLNHSK
jgi:PleD family two-component response regulator